RHVSADVVRSMPRYDCVEGHTPATFGKVRQRAPAGHDKVPEGRGILSTGEDAAATDDRDGRKPQSQLLCSGRSWTCDQFEAAEFYYRGVLARPREPHGADRVLRADAHRSHDAAQRADRRTREVESPGTKGHRERRAADLRLRPEHRELDR